LYPLEAKRQHTGSEGVNPLLQLSVRPTDLLVPDDQGLTAAKRSTIRSKCTPIVSPINGVSLAP
jgi:hypothetical protein